MHVQHLTSVDGEIVWDVDPDVVDGAMGRRYLREGLTVDDAALLARAATFRAALFEERFVGAAATIRPRLIDTDDDTLTRFRAEIEPLAESNRFHLVAETTGVAGGVVAAMEAWFGALEGRRVAIRGFDDIGAEIAAGVEARGGRLVGVSNRSGAVAASGGLDVRSVTEARSAHGELFVTQLGMELHLPDELLGLAVDALVLGGDVGSIDAEVAGRIGASVVVPTTDALYNASGLDTLRRRRITALPDVVTTAGPSLAATAPRGLTPAEAAARAERLIAERIDGARRSKIDPFRYVTTLADTFLTTWVPAAVRPTEPAVRTAPAVP